MVTNVHSAGVNLSCLLPELPLTDSLAKLAICGLSIDSRKVEPGYVFVAMAGLQTHGKTFIPQAVANGAVAILLDSCEANVDSATEVPVILVDELEQKLSGIAGRFYGQPSSAMPLIGITGTNGKTTCSQLLAQALANLDKPCGVSGTLGYGLVKKQGHIPSRELVDTGMTTPDAISTQAICAELRAQGAKYLAMEISSHAMVQGRVAGLDINTAVFTNLTHDHLDYHGSMAAYGKAKASLFAMPSVSAAVVNRDDDFAGQIIAASRANCRLLTFGLGQRFLSSGCQPEHFSLANIRFGVQGITADLVTPQGRQAIATQLLGRFNLSNLLAVIACLYVHGISIADIVSVIPMLEAISGRMELIRNQLGLQVVVDFAHTPDALRKSLEALAPHTKGELWCVFGCGGDRDREKRPLMAAVAEEIADQIVVTSDNPRRESASQIFADIERGFQKNIGINRKVITDRADAIAFALNTAQRGDVVLIAGKGHENYQLIGNQRLPFSDQQQARFCLRQRENVELRHA